MSEETTKPEVQVETPVAAESSEQAAPVTAAKPAAKPVARPPARPPARPASRPGSTRSNSYQQRSRSGSRDRNSRPRRARVCQFCVEKTDYIDYKKPELLLTFISPYGKMLGRRRTGVCAKHQRSLALAIKRARFLALLPYTAEHIRQSGS